MASSNRVVAVTGATGFIGQALCARLRQSGWTVKALVRQPDSAANLADTGVELIEGDLANTGALKSLLQGTNAVVHCAGSVRGACQADFDRTNVEGTANLLAVLKQHSPDTNIILLSSMAAIEPGLSWYANSKFRAEQLLTENPGSLGWAVLRPAAVYGPGDKEMVPIFQLMARGIAPVPGQPENRVCVVHVDDVVAAILALLKADRLPGKAMNICDGHEGGYNWFELAELAGSVWQRRVRILRLPQLLTNLVARTNLSLARLLGYAPMLTPPKLRELRHNWVIDNRELEAACDWRASISLEQGLRNLAL